MDDNNKYVCIVGFFKVLPLEPYINMYTYNFKPFYVKGRLVTIAFKDCSAVGLLLCW